MADDEHLRILKQGVGAWNEWRASNPKIRPNLRNADLSGAILAYADLTRADLTGADLTGAKLIDPDLTDAKLTGADLTDAYLTGADLTDADLTGANLTGANLRGAKLPDADLSGANLKRASLGDAIFTGAQVNSKTQGLDELSDDQRDGLVHVDRDPDAGAQSDAPSRATQITVETAQRIVGPAHAVLIGLAIPNDLSEAHRELFLELLRTVEDLKRDLAGVTVTCPPRLVTQHESPGC